jgi:polyribonucleotide nucleotidyltransferase
VKIDPEMIGMVIGPGGKKIKAITEETGAKVDIADDGTVTIASLEAAKKRKGQGYDRGDRLQALGWGCVRR